ncbi:MAG: glycosyltransferase [Desulfobulbaceae bacterium]|nr:glycosyltransferase [Desulfobulbaceae bacterium]
MGGAERNLLQILAGLDNKRFKPIVCCLSGGEVAASLKEQGYEIYTLGLRRIYDFQAVKSLLWLRQLIIKRRIRLIVSYHESSDFLGLMAARFAGIPIISSRRDMGYKLNKRHVLLYRLCNRYFTRIIAVSEAVKSMIVQREKASFGKIVTIYNGVEAGLYAESVDKTSLKRSLGIREDDRVVGIIAGLRTIKGHRYFIQAAAEVVKEISGVKFLVIGKDEHEPGCSAKELIRYACNLGIDEQIIIAGERRDIPELLAMIDIVVNPSLSEGMSNTILEAMAAGKTVIASDVGGNSEVIEHRKTGFLFPPQDTKTLSTLIVECLKNTKKAELIGMNAKKAIHARHDVKAMCEQNMALYQQCIENYAAKKSSSTN